MGPGLSRSERLRRAEARTTNRSGDDASALGRGVLKNPPPNGPRSVKSHVSAVRNGRRLTAIGFVGDPIARESRTIGSGATVEKFHRGGKRQKIGARCFE